MLTSQSKSVTQKAKVSFLFRLVDQVLILPVK